MSTVRNTLGVIIIISSHISIINAGLQFSQWSFLDRVVPEKVSIPNRWRIIENDEGRGRWILESKSFKGSYEANRNFQRNGRGSSLEHILLWGRYGYFLECFTPQLWIYSRTSIKRPPFKQSASIKWPFFKVPNYFSVSKLQYSIPLLNSPQFSKSRGWPLNRGPTVVTYQVELLSEALYVLNSSREAYLDHVKL